MRTPVEEHLKLTDTKQHLSEVVNRVAAGESRVVIEKSGLPVVAMISTAEYRRFVQFDKNWEKEPPRSSESAPRLPMCPLKKSRRRSIARSQVFERSAALNVVQLNDANSA